MVANLGQWFSLEGVPNLATEASSLRHDEGRKISTEVTKLVIMDSIYIVNLKGQSLK